MLELLAIELPATLRFLEPGWLLMHAAAIPLVFILGMAMGRRSATRPGLAGARA